MYFKNNSNFCIHVGASNSGVSSAVLPSPAKGNSSMQNNIDSASLKHRLKRLDLTPSHFKPVAEGGEEEDVPQLSTPEAFILHTQC